MDTRGFRGHRKPMRSYSANWMFKDRTCDYVLGRRVCRTAEATGDDPQGRSLGTWL
jgi:hypothetical protein